MASAPNPAAKLRHVRPVRPLHFPDHEPEEEHLGQHPRHWELCVVLTRLLRALLGDEHAVSADMFVYWIASVNDDRGRRAPDAGVKLGLPQGELMQHGARRPRANEAAARADAANARASEAAAKARVAELEALLAKKS